MANKKTKARAFVLRDGSAKTVRDAIRAVALKGESKSLASDSFAEGGYDGTGLVVPLYSIEALANLLEINTYHNRCVQTIARDTTSLGWSIVPEHEDTELPEDRVSEIEALFKRPNPRQTLEQVLFQNRVDYEATGNAYLEIIRDGDPMIGEPVSGFNHIPAHTVRVHKDGKRIQQRRGNRKVWFKRYGVEDPIDAKTGEVAEGSDTLANEVVHFLMYTPRSDFYGVPNILPALSAVMMERERQEYMLDFFENHAIPAYAVTVVGAEVDEEFEKVIQDYFQREVREHRHSTLVLTISGEGSNADSVEIKFEKLATEQKEASFRKLGHDTRDEILAAHGVPPYRAGIPKEGSLGGNIAVEATEIYKSSIIEPRQHELETFFSRLIEEAFQLEGAMFRFEDIDTRDEKVAVEIANSLRNAKAISRNEMREAAGYDRDDDERMDLILEDGEPTREPADEEEAETIRSLKSLHEKLVQVVYAQREVA